MEVLGFPCNQFLLQEPAANDEILNFLKYVRPANGFAPTFPMFQKVEVNGDNANALYKSLRAACPAVKTEIGDPKNFYWTPITTSDITWNFQKFLVDADGIPYKRYDPVVIPAMVRKDIDLLLKREY